MSDYCFDDYELKISINDGEIVLAEGDDIWIKSFQTLCEITDINRDEYGVEVHLTDEDGEKYVVTPDSLALQILEEGLEDVENVSRLASQATNDPLCVFETTAELAEAGKEAVQSLEDD